MSTPLVFEIKMLCIVFDADMLLFFQGPSKSAVVLKFELMYAPTLDTG